jgi:hypothetical protein
MSSLSSRTTGTSTRGKRHNCVDPRMSWLERDFHLALLAMDLPGLQGYRKNPRLHRAFEVPPPEDLPHAFAAYLPLCNDALLMAVPHINRLGSLTISVPSNILSSLFNYFPFPAPLLEELKILLRLNCPRSESVIPSIIFPDHLSPLRKLSLSNVVTDLPWRNLSNLTVFEFHHFSGMVDPLFMGQLLDFFESAPLLREIALHDQFRNLPPFLLDE